MARKPKTTSAAMPFTPPIASAQTAAAVISTPTTASAPKKVTKQAESGGMIKIRTNVYEATVKRLDVVFHDFDNIYVSFSGGKDSGVLLNLVLKYMRERGITRKIGVFHQDFEAQYTETTRYVDRVMTSNLDLIDPYRCCLPMSCKTATSMHEQYWTPWNPAQKEIWVRDMPNHPGVINMDNCNLDFFRPGMLQEEVYKHFSSWYHRIVGGGRGRTIGLVGIRADESQNRRNAVSHGIYTFEGHGWILEDSPNVFKGYPIYDWHVDDVWTANARFGFDYNKLYDIFHLAGLSPHEMRVASPFNDWAISSLKLYKTVEPDIWGKMVGRVNGANFCAIYGGTSAVGWKGVKLPEGHTWQSYVAFLLDTLPHETAESYREKFRTSFEYWTKKGGVLSDQTIDELRSMGIGIQLHGTTNYKSDKQRVTFSEYPDDLEVSEFQSVPTYKRMAICILKNDHLCKYMGFSQTKAESEKRKAAIAKYMDL